MMQELIDTLNDKQASLVILHEGKIHSFGGHGVRHLYNLMNENPNSSSKPSSLSKLWGAPLPR